MKTKFRLEFCIHCLQAFVHDIAYRYVLSPAQLYWVIADCQNRQNPMRGPRE